MPLVTLRCLDGHEDIQYLASRADLGCRTVLCPVSGCNQTMAPAPSFGVPLLWFSEGTPRRLMNIDPQREIRSHGQHQRLMKEKGLEPATDWHTSKRHSV